MAPCGWADNQIIGPLTPDEFRTQFSRAFQAADHRRLEELAVGHRYLLRPGIEYFLNEYSQAASRSDPKKSTELLSLATALAEFARNLSNDDFPMEQIKRYQSWSADQYLIKTKADASLAEARGAFQQGRYREVIAPGEAAVSLYASLGDVAGEGDTLHFLGQAHRKSAHYQEALKSHERALSLAKVNRDRLRRGRALIDLGDVFERQKDNSQAVESYEEALAILKIPEEWQAAGRALRQLGDIYVAEGDFENAYRVYSQALLYAQEVHDAVYLAEFHDYLGYFYRRLGDFTKAMEHHNQALENAERIADRKLQAQAQARALNHLGLCTEKLAELTISENQPAKAKELYREALSYEEQSLKRAEAGNDRWRQGYVLRALSLIHRELGKLLDGDDALQEYRRSLARADQAHALALGMKEKEWEGLALHHKAMTQALLGQEPEGLATFDQALEIWANIGDLQSMGHAYSFIAQNFHEKRSRHREAILAYDRALATFGKIGDLESQASTLFDKAKIYAKEGRKPETVRLYEKGLTKLEKVRTKSGFIEFKKIFMQKVYNMYEEATIYMLENQFNNQAFSYAESMKARVFLDQLAEGFVNLEKGIDPELKKQRDEIENQIAAMGAEIVDLYKRQPPDDAEIASLKRKSDRLSSKLEMLEKQIRLKNPLYASVQYPKPITLPKLRRILKQDEIMLEYFLSSKGVYCFVITKNEYRVAKISATEEELRKNVGALLENIEGLIKGERFNRTAASNLYEVLIKPFEASIKGKTLIIVPDGILTRIPFEILMSKDKDDRFYLLERFPIKYVQSASVLGILRTHDKKEKKNQSFIGFGDPVYDYENFKKGSPEREDNLKGGEPKTISTQVAGMRFAKTGFKLCRLQGSGNEVQTIKKIFTEHNRPAKVLLRLEAREDYAKAKKVERYGYIHFSTHGILDAKFQAIALSQIPGDQEDGMLTLGEIMNSKYNAQLVVLSACQTGLGTMERGEGVTGLTRAVMYAGSSAAVVSLWSVSDDGTKELMVKFYENMVKQRMTKSAALRSAKLAMLQTQYQHPFYWAAFVMYGE